MNFPTSWNPKYLTEALCAQQVYAPDAKTRRDITYMLQVLAVHRPVGHDGKHGSLHTPTCGCEDNPMATVNESQDLLVEQAGRDVAAMTDAEFEDFIRGSTP